MLSVMGAEEIKKEESEYDALETERGIRLSSPAKDLIIPWDEIEGKTRNQWRVTIPLEQLLPPPEVDQDQPEPQSLSVLDAETIQMVLEANRLFAVRKFYDALIVVDRILTRYPRYVRGWLMKGSLLHMQGEKGLALEAWKKAKRISPKDPEVNKTLAKYK